MVVRLSNKSRTMGGTFGAAAGRTKKAKKPKPHDFGPFKVGGPAYTKNVGYGVTSYEKQKVEKITQDKVKIVGLDYPFSRSSGTYILPPDWPNLGLVVSLCVMPNDIAEAEKYTAED